VDAAVRCCSVGVTSFCWCLLQGPTGGTGPAAVAQALAPALRITRSEYDHSARISEVSYSALLDQVSQLDSPQIVAMQAASIASSEGVRGELEAYSGSVDGGIRSSARSGRAGSGRRGHSAGFKMKCEGTRRCATVVFLLLQVVRAVLDPVGGVAGCRARANAAPLDAKSMRASAMGMRGKTRCD
jgi:hypothetical protein